MSCRSFKLYFKVQIPIAHTTVSGAAALTSQLNENLNIKLQESIEIMESF